MSLAFNIITLALLFGALVHLLLHGVVRTWTPARLLLAELLVWSGLTLVITEIDWNLSPIEISLLEVGYLTMLVMAYLFFLVAVHNEETDRQTSEARGRFKLLEELVDLSTFRLSPQGILLHVNPLFSQTTGFDIPSLVGRPFVERLNKEDVAEAKRKIERVFRTGVTVEFGARFHFGDGVDRRVNIRLAPVFHRGEVVEVLGTSRDLTQQHRAVSQATFLSSVITESNQPIMIVNEDGRILVWNRGMELLTGVTRTNAIERPYSDLLPDVPDLVLECAVGEGAYSTELLLHAPGEGIPVLLTAYAVEIGDRSRAYAVYIQDLTRQRRLEEQLLHHQRMEALGKLAGGVAHDFNNVLTIISGNAAILKKQKAVGDEFIPHLDGIIRSTRRGATLTEQLLTFSRRHPFTPKQIEVADLIDDTVDLISHAGWSGIHFEVSVEPNVPPMMVDSGRMQQVLLNLCVNARDAMPKGGTIHISAQSRSFLSERDLPRAQAVEPGTYVEVAIRDTGIGMDRATIERIFEPFFTTKGPSKGTGLGLSNVHGIVQQHRGWMEVESTPNVGSTFRIFLPSADHFEKNRKDDVSKERKTPPRRRQVREPVDPFLDPPMKETGSVPELHGRETVLLVDDESLVREVGKTALELYGYTVLTASDGRDAMDVFEENRGKIDIVVLDWAMREHGGREVLKELREAGETVPVLIQSGVWHDQQQSEVMEQGANALLTKPYLPEKLIEVIRNLLGKSSSESRSGTINGIAPPA